MKTTASAPKTGPDVKEMAGRDLPRGQFPGRGANEFRVFLDGAVHGQIGKHAREDVSVEICGVLVGTWKKDDDGPYVEITAAIPGEAVANKLSEVTFTHETWAKIHKRMDSEFADKSIVGWYHTHPDFGIFLSDRDCFIHEHFFREPGQVAYVVDPIRKEEGFFTWSQGKPTPCPHYWVGHELRTAPPLETDRQERRDRGRKVESTGGEAPRRAAANEALPPLPYAWVSNALLGVCLFLVGFLLSRYLGALSEENNLTRFAIMKSLKPGLGTSLSNVSQRLQNLSGASAHMAELSGRLPPEDAKKAWTEAAAMISECQRALETLRAVYALSPEEEEMLQKLSGGMVKVSPAQPSAPATTQSTLAATTQPTTKTSK
jgi:proteasome lid subunit RPN8/RPN11